jgi:hypothetical protein
LPKTSFFGKLGSYSPVAFTPSTFRNVTSYGFPERIIAAMALIEQGQPPYIFRIRSPSYVRALGVLLLIVGVAPCSFVIWKIGLTWIPLELGPSLFLIASVIGLVLFGLWLVFPPQSTLARFEFTGDRIRFVPNLLARSIGERSEETAIPPQSSEILIAHYFVPEKVNGYRIVVRTPNGPEQQLASRSPHTQVRLNALEIDNLAAAIAPVARLPVRVVMRRTSQSGTAQETPWTPPSQEGTPLKFAVLSTFSFPYAGGIFMGWYYQNPAVVIGAGFALWFCMVLAIDLASRTGPTPRKFPSLQVLTTLVAFWTAYGLCYVVTAHLRGHI